VNIWRKVKAARLRVGRGSVLGPDTGRRPRWWELDLECGHTAERHVRYRRLAVPQSQGTRRTAGDVLPAPVLVSCAPCTAAVMREIAADRKIRLDSSKDNG
jgi:hypothetical protein